VRGGELDLVRPRPEKGAGRLSRSRRNPLRGASGQIDRVYLIERIARLTLALKDKTPAVGGPVSFAGALSFDGEPPDTRQEIAFPRLALREERGSPEKKRRESDCKQRSSHVLKLSRG
jgi:hypothetical protein